MMKKIDCENVLMAQMSELDGEETELSTEQINLHLMECKTCRQELEQLQTVDKLFKGLMRQEQNADLWMAIEERIATKNDSSISWQPFLLLAILLIVWKLLEMLTVVSFSWLFKLVPLVLIIALFVFLKENPFKINTELAPGEIKL